MRGWFGGVHTKSSVLQSLARLLQAPRCRWWMQVLTDIIEAVMSFLRLLSDFVDRLFRFAFLQ